MTSCSLKILGNPVPLAKIDIDNSEGFVHWKRIPLAAGVDILTGKVTIEGKNSVLINGPGRFAGKIFGTLIDFNLLHYNKAITYTLVSGKNHFQCRIDD